MQRRRAQRQSLRLVRGGRRRRHGAREGHVRQARGLDLLEPRAAAADARAGQGRRRGTSAGSRTSMRSIARVLEEVKTDAGLGALLKVNSTPTFFINGRRVPTAQGIPSPAVIDAIIEAGAEAGQVTRDMPAAIRIEELTKDYAVGFWRKRPYRALDRLSLADRAGRGLRLSRSERRRQDDHAQAADAADFSVVRPRRDPGAAGRRRADAASASATFPRTRTSTTT